MVTSEEDWGCGHMPKLCSRSRIEPDRLAKKKKQILGSDTIKQTDDINVVTPTAALIFSISLRVFLILLRDTCSEFR
jgi:hypothetical protein